MSYQPSEGLKLFYILLFSNLLTSKKYYLCFGVFATTTLCLVLQPDLGNAALVSIITIILLIQAGLNKIIIAGCGFVLSVGAAIAICIFPHSRYRYLSFFSKAESYQNIRALAAIKAGGLVGVGAGKGSIKHVLPDAYSDFVFAIIGEELGFLGCTIICASFLVFILRIWYFYSILPRVRESLWFLGIGLLIALQAWIHMASSVWLIPPKGTNLPFISHGGTSLIIFNLGFGILARSIEIARKKWITGYKPSTLVKSI
jgi:cell division protein FtsW